MTPGFTTIPVCSIRPYGLILYDRKEYYTKRPKEFQKNLFRKGEDSKGMAQRGQKAYTGFISQYSKKRLKRAIGLITAIAKEKRAIAPKSKKEFSFKLNFITLTLSAPQGNLTDKQIKKELLDIFLKRAKRKWKLNSYVWRAEKQKNGNLHFHIITDCWIHYQELRDCWNDCQERLGLITEFERKEGHRHPNSTDVHSIQKIKNLSAYFSKYMTKGSEYIELNYRIPFKRNKSQELKTIKQLKNSTTQQKDKGITLKYQPERKNVIIQGKVWDCSQNLKIKQNCEVLIDSEVREVIENIINDPTTEIKTEPLFTIIFLSSLHFTAHVKGSLRKAWVEYLAYITNFNTS
jgi:hypothetical protein